MFDYIKNMLIGDIEGKKVYKQMMKRVGALPEDYKFAFHKIQHYMYVNGVGDITIFVDLIDLFEASAADGRKVLDVIGNDVSKFCDEFMSTSVTYVETLREKLNKEIMEKFDKGDNNYEKYHKKMIEDKKEYKNQMARAAALPEDYRFVFDKIQKYMWSFAGGDGSDMLKIQYELIELFESSAADGRHVLDVTGKDVAKFCDEFLCDAKMWTDTYRLKLNCDMKKKFGKGNE